MSDFEFPRDFYYNLLLPAAKKLKLRYISKNPQVLLGQIFRELSRKMTIFNTTKITPVLEDIQNFISPFSTFFEIIAELSRPLTKLIPPEYLIILIAIALVPTVIIPGTVFGGFALYKAEQWVKLPFRNVAKLDLDKVPLQVRELTTEITKVTKKTIKFKIYNWFDMPGPMRRAFYYEAPAELKTILMSAEKLLSAYPGLTSKQVFELIQAQQQQQIEKLPFQFLDLEDLLEEYLVDLEQEIELSAHFYSGWRRILPPVMTTIIKGINFVFEKANSLDNEQKIKLMDSLEWLIFGIWKPLLEKKGVIPK